MHLAHSICHAMGTLPTVYAMQWAPCPQCVPCNGHLAHSICHAMGTLPTVYAMQWAPYPQCVPCNGHLTHSVCHAMGTLPTVYAMQWAPCPQYMPCNGHLTHSVCHAMGTLLQCVPCNGHLAQRHLTYRTWSNGWCLKMFLGWAHRSKRNCSTQKNIFTLCVSVPLGISSIPVDQSLCPHPSAHCSCSDEERVAPQGDIT